MRCPSCEVEVSEHQEFCDACGSRLAAPSPDDTQERPADGEAPEPTDEMEAPQAPDPSTRPIEDFEAPEPTTQPIEEVAEPTPQVDEEPDVASEVTEPVVVMAGLDNAAATTEIAAFPPPPPGAPFPAPEPLVAPTATAELPSLFDGSGDIEQFPEPREPFRLRLAFLLSLFGAGAMLMAIVADVIDIRTSRPTAGITTGIRTLEDLGSNLALAGFVGVAVMVLGALLSCFGLRWGAGLAGGAGLALAGWAGLTIGLAEQPIAVAESITRTSTSPEPFTLTVTRDLGWWLIAGVGAIGVVVFLATLRWIGTGRRVALNPLVAALTAVATVILGFGPLVPVKSASYTDNFRSTDPAIDLPAAFFGGRLGQVGLIVLAGVVGMLLVRSYGLGLAAGGVSVSVWLWASSFAEIGESPIGIAVRNPGAETTVPHAVTTAGMVATLVLLLVAAVLATWRLTRTRSRSA